MPNGISVNWVYSRLFVDAIGSYANRLITRGMEYLQKSPTTGAHCGSSRSSRGIFAIFDDNLGTTKWRGKLVPDGSELARVLTAGGSYSYNFMLESETYDGGILGVLDIFHDGTLNVRVQSGLLGLGTGDFYLASSSLIAYGDNGDPAPAPVPEPTTLMLLGSGLVAAVAFGRRKLGSK